MPQNKEFEIKKIRKSRKKLTLVIIKCVSFAKIGLLKNIWLQGIDTSILFLIH